MLVCGVTEKFEEKLRKARNLESRSKRDSVSIEETLEAALDFYLKHKDPVEKAERVLGKQQCVRTVPVNARTTTIPAVLQHQVNLRDRGKCQTPNCENTRFIEIHHIRPLSEGGKHEHPDLSS
jgi:hypothetical protein